MPTLRVTLKGSLGQISATSFASVLSRSLSILHDLDTRLSEQRGGSLRWVVASVGEGSLYVDISSRTIRGDEDFGPPVHDAYTEGLQTLTVSGTTPPYFSVENVRSVRAIVRDIGRDGVAAVEFRDLESLSPTGTELTQEVEPALQKLVGEAYHALGSVEGRVELVSIQKRSRRFNITLDRNLQSVTCSLPAALEDAVLDAMKQHRRIVVRGRITYNAKSEPIRVAVGGAIRLLGAREELPTAHELAGSDPELTGDMSTEDYVRSLRDG